MTTRALKFRNFLKVGDILPRTFKKVEVRKKFDLLTFGKKVIPVKGVKAKTFGQTFLRIKKSIRKGKTEDDKDIIRNISDVGQLFQPENLRKIGDMSDSQLRLLIRGLRDTGFSPNFKLHDELKDIATTQSIKPRNKPIQPEVEGWLTAAQVKTVIPFVAPHAMLNWQKRTNLNITSLRGSLSLRKPIWLFARLPDRIAIPVTLSNLLNIKTGQKYNLVNRIIVPANMGITEEGNVETEEAPEEEGEELPELEEVEEGEGEEGEEFEIEEGEGEEEFEEIFEGRREREERVAERERRRQERERLIEEGEGRAPEIF